MIRINNLSLASVIILSIALSGCLKTRTGVKNDDDDSPAEIDHNSQPSPQKGGKKQPPMSRYELEEVKNEMTRLSGKVDELDHQQRSSQSADIRETVTKLDTRVAELEKNQMLLLSELKEIKDKGIAGTSNGAGSAPKTKKDLAEQHFQSAEAFFENEEYKKAIVEYSKVQEVFSKSPRVPTSLYRIGQCFDRLGMKKEAEGFYSELVEKYPNSAEVKKMKSGSAKAGAKANRGKKKSPARD